MGHPKTRPGVRTAGIRQFPTSGTLLAQGKGQLIAWVQILGSTVRQCLYFVYILSLDGFIGTVVWEEG